MVDIIVPTFNRPHVLEKLSNNIREVSSVPYKLNFILEKEDTASIDIVANKTNDFAIVGTFRSYANAFNTGYFLTTEPFLIMGSDDIEFKPGWDTEAIACMNENVHVVGINSSGLLDDRCNLQFIFRRAYVESHSLVTGSPNLPFYPYCHNFVDTELNFTARHRGVFFPCPKSIVIHHRPSTDTDSTYIKNNSTAEIDRETYNSRKHLFKGV